jgi:hypothetical protein
MAPRKDLRVLEKRVVEEDNGVQVLGAQQAIINQFFKVIR